MSSTLYSISASSANTESIISTEPSSVATLTAPAVRHRKPRVVVDDGCFWARRDALTASGVIYQTKRGRPRQGVPSLAGTLAAEFDISVQTARRLLRRGRPFQVRHVQGEAVA